MLFYLVHPVVYPVSVFSAVTKFLLTLTVDFIKDLFRAACKEVFRQCRAKALVVLLRAFRMSPDDPPAFYVAHEAVHDDRAIF